MQVVHLLRKYNPSEWGGTETAIKRLLDGLRHHEINSVVLCPRIDSYVGGDPLREAGHEVRRFHAFAPVLGISKAQREQLIAVGGNLLSFDLPGLMLREKGVSVIHTHAGNRLGGVALTIAKIKKLPLVATIHGGILDLPEKAKEFLRQPLKGGFEWGKVFGVLLRSRKVLAEADAILTCNKKEAELQQKQFPHKRIVVQPHGVPAAEYQKDSRDAAIKAFPQISGKDLLLSVGRIDPVKNQGWLVDQAPQIFSKHPNAILVIAGSCTDVAYGKMVEKKIQALGLENRILLTGGLPPGDPRLIGLFQQAKAVLLPSLSETFGLVILEAWAAGTPVISSTTSGALDLIRENENGWLFDWENPKSFHHPVEIALTKPKIAARFGETGRALVLAKYDVNAIGAQVKKLYEELVEEKK